MSTQKKQASALAVAMICLGLFLIIALSVSLVSLSEKKAATGANKSSLAFQVANSGAEKVLQLIKINSGKTVGDIDNNCDGIIDDGAGYEVEIRDKDSNVINDCSKNISEIASIKSTGTSGQNQRAISVVAAAETPAVEFQNCSAGATNSDLNACEWRICLSTTNCSEWYGVSDQTERMIMPTSSF